MAVPQIKWNKIETWFGEVMDDDDDDDSSPREDSYFVNILNSDFTALISLILFNKNKFSMCLWTVWWKVLHY